MRNVSTAAIVVGSLIIHFAVVGVRAETIISWNFSRGLQNWSGNHHVEDLTYSQDGLSFRSTGVDPWIEGPAINLPGDQYTKVTLRMRSNANSSGELFYGAHFQAGDSVTFTVNNDDLWHDYELVIMEMLGSRTRFRLDPATTAGEIHVAWISVETIPVYDDPPFDSPSRPNGDRGRSRKVESGPLTLRYFGPGFGDMVAEVAEQEMASAYDKELLGVLFDDGIEWLNLQNASVEVDPNGDGLDLRAEIVDRDGAVWWIERQIHPESDDGAIRIDVSIQASADRDVVCLPWLTLFPGLDTFGSDKTQGLLAGLEYLANEPSSSEADITTLEHVRRVPDPVKVTFPLMAVAAEGCYLGLIWERSEWIGPMYDSPDTIFGSEAHVMGLTGPAVGSRRFENTLLGHTPIHLTADVPITATIWIVGGAGATVAPAVEQYVNLRGLPPVPSIDGGFTAPARLFAHGWLDSALNEDGLFRHAVWGSSFAAGVAPDAAMFMDYLAASLDDEDAALIDALQAGRDLALANVPANWHMDGGVSHVRPPTPALLFGDIDGFVERRKGVATSYLTRFEPDGTMVYVPGDVDYGATHFTDHANGYSAGELAAIVEAVTLSADSELAPAALDLLDKQTLLYAGTVPRGAQTWEVPLHTPDILASAYLVKAYTLGYIATGREDYLEQARYWAWTGVPFLYLLNPTSGDVGSYATIPVLGATNWRGSWFGRPVQWCGLVYASALHLLSGYDAEGPWAQIARGITAAGTQMAWSVEDAERQGLLPDYFLLEAQHRDGPAINPGTTQAHLPELFDLGRIYDVKCAPMAGCFVHAPCEIRDLAEEDHVLSFLVSGWGAKGGPGSYHVLVSGWTGNAPTVTVYESLGDSGFSSEGTSPVTSYLRGSGLLIVEMTGPAKVSIYY